LLKLKNFSLAQRAYIWDCTDLSKEKKLKKIKDIIIEYENMKKLIEQEKEA
jgi:hypothetical protein